MSGCTETYYLSNWRIHGFDYEPNKFRATVTSVCTEAHAVRLGGGLRINFINYYDGSLRMPASQKYCRYGELDDGIGLIINSPRPA